MAETTAPKPRTTKTASKAKAASASNKTDAPESNKAEAKAKFAKALEEAKAGAQALGKEAQERAGSYREQLHSKSENWRAEAKTYGEQAKTQAGELAREGKAKTSDAIASLGKMVSDSATVIDEKLGQKYGDYARTAARSMQETAAKIDAKELDEIGEDVREFVRKSPGVAVGIAAVAGFMVARMLRGSKD